MIDKGAEGLKAKEYLRKLELLDVVIGMKLQELDDLRKRIYEAGEVKGVACSNEKVKCSASSEATFEKRLVKLIDMENEIKADIDTFVDKKHEMIQKIQCLQNPRQIEVLYKRYVEFKSLEMIAVEMGYTYQHVRRLHISSLKSFEKMLQQCNTMLQKKVI